MENEVLQIITDVTLTERDKADKIDILLSEKLDYQRAFMNKCYFALSVVVGIIFLAIIFNLYNYGK